MTYGGTGTPATPPHQVTAAELIDEARIALADTGETPTFADDALLSFLNEAIREYSQHLPRVSTTTITTAAAERSYALPWDAINVTEVRDDDDEPLTRMSHKRRSFSHFTYYDFLSRLDLTNPPALLLSFDPSAAEEYQVTYTRPHDHELTSTSYLTVPADHHHVLLQYILFAASRQLQATEEAAPTSNSSLLMSQYASNTRRYELAYLNAINRILYHRRAQSQTVSWRMDDNDRVY